MLAFLGFEVSQPLSNLSKYADALQEIKHYLCLKGEDIQETDYVLHVGNGNHSFSLVKDPLYLHTNYYPHPIVEQQDFNFLETCWECLMIICESFPASVTHSRNS